MTGESLELILKTMLNFELDFWRGKIQFDFCGGEPLLNFDIVNTVYPKIYKRYKHLGVISSITTNLTLLPNNLIEFYHTVNPYLNVSMDSFIYSKPYKNGKSSAVDVLNNLEILTHENISPIINTTIIDCDNNINELNTFAEYIAEKKLRWNLGFEFQFNGDFTNSLHKVKKCINILRKNNYDIHNLFQFNRILKNLPSKICFSITNDKNIYPYFPIVGEKHIGHLSNIFNVLTEHYKYNYEMFYYNLWEKCKICSVRLNCCNYTIIPESVSDINCELSKEITKYLETFD